MALPSLQEAAKMVLMNPYQVEQTEASIRSLKKALAGGHVAFDGDSPEPIWRSEGDGPADPEALQRSLERDTLLLKAHDPRPIATHLTPYEKAQLWKRIEGRIERIRQGMPNDEQMRRASSQDIDLHMRWEATHLEDILGLKTDLRLIDPSNDDPNFLNIDRFRPLEPSHVDWRTYYANYDEITWQTDLETELEPLDEDRFQRFCLLKAANWSAKGIQRDVGLTDAQYEQAMERLRVLREQMTAESEPERRDISPDEPFESQRQVLATELSAEMYEHTLGPWFKHQIEQRGLNQTAVGRAVGMTHPGTFGRYLSGASPMMGGLASALFRYLNLDPAQAEADLTRKE